MSLPHITPRQHEILKLLYRFRFLERKHIQALLGHKDKRRISAWLKELRDTQFINWHYDAAAPAVVSKPAIYFLGRNGIRSLKQAGYPYDQLQQRYKDTARQPDFIARCLLLADCCIHLETRTRDGAMYAYALEADFTTSGSYTSLSDNEYIRPHLVFIKHGQDGASNQTYCLETFSPSTPRYMVKKKIRGYVDYLTDNEQRGDAAAATAPIILLAFPSIAAMAYAKRYTRKQINELWDDIPDGIKIRVSTIEKLRAEGLTAIIWEDI